MRGFWSRPSRPGITAVASMPLKYILLKHKAEVKGVILTEYEKKIS